MPVLSETYDVLCVGESAETLLTVSRGEFIVFEE